MFAENNIKPIELCIYNRLDWPLFEWDSDKLLPLLLDDFFGLLNTRKWAKIANCSQDTALRDIQDLIEKGVLRKGEAGGRRTNYELVV